MKYLFDSNVWIAIQRGDPRIRQRWIEQLPENIFLCAPVLAELYIGALKSQRTRENMKFVDEITNQHDCLAFGIAEAARFAELTSLIGKDGVKTMDLQIGAIASVHGLRIVTHDIFDFGRIPDVNMEDWQA